MSWYLTGERKRDRESERDRERGTPTAKGRRPSPYLAPPSPLHPYTPPSPLHPYTPPFLVSRSRHWGKCGVHRAKSVFCLQIGSPPAYYQSILLVPPPPSATRSHWLPALPAARIGQYTRDIQHSGRGFVCYHVLFGGITQVFILLFFGVLLMRSIDENCDELVSLSL